MKWQLSYQNEKNKFLCADELLPIFSIVRTAFKDNIKWMLCFEGLVLCIFFWFVLQTINTKDPERPDFSFIPSSWFSDIFFVPWCYLLSECMRRLSKYQENTKYLRFSLQRWMENERCSESQNYLTFTDKLSN